jgi:hypothetical protein
MAQITFPIVSGELLVDLRINLSAPDMALRQAAQQPALPSAVARALLDTGSNATGVSSAILQQFPLTPSAQSQTQGLSSTTAVQLFDISLVIFDPAQPHLQTSWFAHTDLTVLELPPGSPIDVLIGMNVLLQCRMLLDGPGRQFTLDF